MKRGFALFLVLSLLGDPALASISPRRPFLAEPSRACLNAVYFENQGLAVSAQFVQRTITRRAQKENAREEEWLRAWTRAQQAVVGKIPVRPILELPEFWRRTRGLGLYQTLAAAYAVASLAGKNGGLLRQINTPPVQAATEAVGKGEESARSLEAFSALLRYRGLDLTDPLDRQIVVDGAGMLRDTIYRSGNGVWILALWNTLFRRRAARQIWQIFRRLEKIRVLFFQDRISLAVGAWEFMRRGSIRQDAHNTSVVIDLLRQVRDRLAPRVVFGKGVRVINVVYGKNPELKSRMVWQERTSTRVRERETFLGAQTDAFREAIRNGLGPTTILFDVHGTPSLLLTDVDTRYFAQEFAADLAVRGHLSEVTILLESCMSCDFAVSVLQKLFDDHGLKELPCFIVGAPTGLLTHAGFFYERLSLFLERLRTIKFEHFYMSEIGGKDMVILAPASENELSEALAHIRPAPDWEGPYEPGPPRNGGLFHEYYRYPIVLPRGRIPVVQVAAWGLWDRWFGAEEAVYEVAPNAETLLTFFVSVALTFLLQFHAPEMSPWTTAALAALAGQVFFSFMALTGVYVRDTVTGDYQKVSMADPRAPPLHRLLFGHFFGFGLFFHLPFYAALVAVLFNPSSIIMWLFAAAAFAWARWRHWRQNMTSFGVKTGRIYRVSV